MLFNVMIVKEDSPNKHFSTGVSLKFMTQVPEQQTLERVLRSILQEDVSFSIQEASGEIDITVGSLNFHRNF